MKKQKLIGKISNNPEAGFTLLEYVAGAAVIIGIVFSAFTSMGNGLKDFFTGIGAWATAKAPSATSNGTSSNN